MCATRASHRTPSIGPLRSRGTPRLGGILQPIVLKFRVNSGRISVGIKAANGRNRAFYAVSLVSVMAFFALVGQVLPVQRNTRVRDVSRCQQDLVVDDVTEVLPANLAHAAIDPDTFPNIAIPAELPRSALVKLLCPWLCHSITSLQGKTKSLHHGSHSCDTWHRL